uniref:Mitochondrial splicing suppressor 51-like C-terminal domain-containing protein n=1 Tax=Oncorhynchus tshawytscha TaxID=74940 RepID=A0AAZ3RVD6_ONCTS
MSFSLHVLNHLLPLSLSGCFSVIRPSPGLSLSGCFSVIRPSPGLSLSGCFSVIRPSPGLSFCLHFPISWSFFSGCLFSTIPGPLSPFPPLFPFSPTPPPPPPSVVCCCAVLYCSDQCSQADQIRCPEDASHQHWCEKLACYMSHESQLAELPFSYAAEVTAVDFDLEHFLNKNKLDSGYWVHWSLLVRGHIFGCQNSLSLSLSLSSVLWSQYCEWRGISLSSPVAVLLSSPLSIYYIITSMVPKDFPELNIQKKQSLKIHIIDSYREFRCLKVFWELSVLLPHMTFELVFIGEGLPPESDEEQLFLQKKNGRVHLVNPSFTPDEKLDRRSIRVKGYRRAYHMLQGPKPDLVIGFRPAILLQESWLSTLPRLQSLRVPAYFCEVGELSCVCSQQVMSQATGGTLSPAHINPFHCPLRITGGDNMLPW